MSKPDQTANEPQGASGDDASRLSELGKACEARDDFPEAAVHYRQALNQLEPGDARRHDLVVRAMYALKRAGQHEAAIHLADLEMDNWLDSPDYYFALGDLLLDWATRNPASAMEELLPMVEASWLKCLEIGERPELEGAVAGRGSYLAAHNLAVLYDTMGDAARAAHFRALAEPPR